jgi:hypothetical protein
VKYASIATNTRRGQPLFQSSCHELTCQDALKDKDPSNEVNLRPRYRRTDSPPSLKVSNAVHMRNAERQKTRERACDRSGTEEERLPKLRLMAAVPHRDLLH